MHSLLCCQSRKRKESSMRFEDSHMCVVTVRDSWCREDILSRLPAADRQQKVWLTWDVRLVCTVYTVCTLCTHEYMTRRSRGYKDCIFDSRVALTLEATEDSLKLLATFSEQVHKLIHPTFFPASSSWQTWQDINYLSSAVDSSSPSSEQLRVSKKSFHQQNFFPKNVLSHFR